MKQNIHKQFTNTLIEAIRNKDIESIKRIKEDIGRERWLNRFNGSVPPTAWLEENPFVEFKEKYKQIWACRLASEVLT